MTGAAEDLDASASSLRRFRRGQSLNQCLSPNPHALHSGGSRLSLPFPFPPFWPSYPFPLPLGSAAGGLLPEMTSKEAVRRVAMGVMVNQGVAPPHRQRTTRPAHAPAARRLLQPVEGARHAWEARL